MATRKSAAPGAPPLAPSAVPSGERATWNVAFWPLAQIKRYPNNPRRNEAAISKVAASIRDFGWQQVIVVDEDAVILAGDTRLSAAQLLGYAEAPVHVAAGLTEEQKRAFRLADNRVAQEAEWDEARLIEEIRALERSPLLTSTGFESAEIADLLDFAIGGVQPHADPEALPPVPKEPKSKIGDLYVLGNHRLICGDATSADTWAILLGLDRAQMIWTDPPYDVDYQGGTKDKLTIQNDNLGHAGTVRLLRALLALGLIHLEEGGAVYVCAPHGPQFYAFAKVGTELGFWRQTILWVKNAFGFGHSDFHYRHEAILTTEGPTHAREVESIGYGWRPGKAHNWYGGRKLDTCWEVDRPRANDEHPTAKPVELIARALEASSKPGDVVVDCCAGGGSLIAACEVHGRHARCIELDPRYVDAAVTRWELLTGRRAVLVQTNKGAQ